MKWDYRVTTAYFLDWSVMPCNIKPRSGSDFGSGLSRLGPLGEHVLRIQHPGDTKSAPIECSLVISDVFDQQAGD